MFKWIALFLLWSTAAWAQNPTCPTRPLGDSTNACASTGFVNQFGTSSVTGTITPNLPVIGNATSNGFTQGTRSGTTTTFGTTTGTLTNGDCVSLNNGNLIDAGGACTVGGGGGTVSSGTKGQPGYYPSSGTTIAGAAGVIYTAATTVAQAITDCGTNTCVLTANLTLGANGTFTGPQLIFPAGVTITQSASYTLNIYGTISAPVQQIFSGFSPGQISFGTSTPNQFMIRPEWWGASPGGTATTNTNAIKSALYACFADQGGMVHLGRGTYSVQGSGTISGSNGAAIRLDSTANPSGNSCDFGGEGMWGSTTLQLAASNQYNVLEIVYGSTTNFPFSWHDMKIDGNGANQTLNATNGDRYQNGAYLEHVANVKLYNLYFTGAAYHGFQANTINNSSLDIWANNNYANGVTFTGSSGNQWNQIHIWTGNNGIGGGAVFPSLCNGDGVFLGYVNFSYVNIVSTGNNGTIGNSCTSGQTYAFGIGVEATGGDHSEIHLVSANDSLSFAYSSSLNYNTIFLTATGWHTFCHQAINGGSDPGNNVVTINCN